MDAWTDWDDRAAGILRAKGYCGAGGAWETRVRNLANKLEAEAEARNAGRFERMGSMKRMDKQALAALARQYKQYKRMEEELKAELDNIADAIKAQVPAGVPVIAGEYKISLANVTQARIDGAALRRDMPGVADKYSKETSYQRLTIS